jgi:hypothetical protein
MGCEQADTTNKLELLMSIPTCPHERERERILAAAARHGVGWHF